MKARRTIASTLLAISVFALSSCSSTDPTVPTKRESPSPMTFACSSPVRAAQTLTEGAAVQPMCVDDAWIFLAPAMDDAPKVRRTEMFLANSSGLLEGHEGGTVIHDVELTANLGESAAQDDGWHVVWQLHGPLADGEWKGPAFGLNIRDGELRLSGGAGHPDHDYNRSNYEWNKALARFTDGQKIHVRVVALLSSDPSRGWISVAIDGKPVLRRWQPVSRSGLHPGTLYPGQSEVQSRIGLYRGSQSEQPPSYTQVVVQRVVESRIQ